jgi:hypothetical protein
VKAQFRGQLSAELWFNVSWGETLLAITIEPFDELLNFGWSGHRLTRRTGKTHE